MLRGLWRYRHFILAAIRGDIRGRFARSRLGALWFILHPLAQALIFAIILSEVLGARLPGVDDTASYAIYLLSGIAAWGLFSEIVNRSMTIFLEQGSAMKKIAFPRLCLPVIVWGSALINHALLLLAIVVVFAFMGHTPGSGWLAVPLGIVLISLLGFGIGVLCGIMNVFARDVGQVMTVVLQMWFWLTPIVYHADIVPARFEWLIHINPMTPLVGVYQDALLFDRLPAMGPLLVPALLGAATFVLSFLVFRRASPELVDAL
ncbi:ABC transporter permease [Aureimonas mangrovi]|uniref:ABC transporter permease n=1 Tax=Aureimonas mangrovi TaxID=2758041 RepID=UPI00163DCD27|nr:ABC transporter permease [Aureimonas mangrovi]